MIDGHEKRGHVHRFDPRSSDVTLDIAVSSVVGGTRRSRMAVPAERVAFIAFDNAEDGPHGDCPMRIHVTGRTVDVLVDGGATKDPIGFYASPDGGAAEYYFYTHGVVAREKREPIGALLLEQGALDRADLERGVFEQAAQKASPLGKILVEQNALSQGEVDRAAEMQKRKKMRIGEVLVEEGYVTGDEITRALAEQKKRRGKRLGEVLVELGVITEVDLALALGNKFDLEFVNLDEMTLDSRAMRSIPRDIISRHGVLPIARDTDSGTVTVAISDPLATDSLEAIRMVQSATVQEVLATPSQLKRFVQAYLSGADASRSAEHFDSILRQVQDEEMSMGAVEDDDDDGSGVNATDSAVIKLVNQVIIDGYRRGASDIHIEPNGNSTTTQIRFRVDGRCFEYKQVPAALRAPLVARLKIMAKLDIAERRKPQDGKIRFRVQDKRIELRVATIPTVNNNEDVVMRILANAKPRPLAEMGFSKKNLVRMKSTIEKPYGLVLCVGPTGSGKTTTLHSALGEINKMGTKIWTAEDPVEITQFGLRQVQVNAKIGFTFAKAMRAFLRADPDVIMVGEMRDHETASIAIEASLTGHLVMSTLHTNTAPETVTRLIDMGIDAFSFSDALLAVLAQRLARRLCSVCRRKAPATEREYRTLMRYYGEEAFARDFDISERAQLSLYVADGCKRCDNTGSKGRVAVHELLVASDELGEAVRGKADAAEIRRIAVDGGMRTLLQDGIAKTLSGQTTLRQVLSVCVR